MKRLPNLLTLGNLFCGVLAIWFTLHTPIFISGFDGHQFLVTSPPPIYWAAILIGIAAVLDFLDGLTARLLKAFSPLGGQLDSLADLVTFGVAPAMILYHLLSEAYMQQPDALSVSLLQIIPALLLPCFTAYRLARFNVYAGDDTGFTGLPAPAVGLVVASFPLIVFYNQMPMAGWLQLPWLLYLLLALFCFLMVSNIPFFSFKIKRHALKSAGLPTILVLCTLISIPFLRWMSIPLAFLLYLLLSIGKFWFAPVQKV